MKMSFKRIGKPLGAIIVSAVITFSLLCVPMSAFAITPIAETDKLGNNNGNYYSSFTSNEELSEATKEKNIEIVSEGVILLKNGGGASGNENKLPYANMKNISLFGINSDAYGYGGTGSGSGQLAEGGDIYSSFEKFGININPRLKALYQRYSGGSLSMVATYTTPTYEDKELPLSYYSDAIQATYARYHDAALVVISRLGGEGADLKVENIQNHVRPDEEGNLVAATDEHYLELTYREEQLIEHVTANFDNVVVLLNTGNVIECKELEENPGVKAVLNIIQTGDFGFDGVLKVLTGEVSPSGRTVDIYPTDFTLDPTYQNFGDGSQTVASGTNYSYKWKATAETAVNDYESVGNEVEYEEGIYLGYKYYETLFAEIKAGHIDPNSEAAKAVLNSKDIPGPYVGANAAELADDWYNKNVVYPFGYGLSYTQFAWSNMVVNMTAGAVSANTKFSVDVTVKNIGAYAGKDVVEIYMHAPYVSGGIEKAEVRLVGFAKTKVLKPDESQTVTIEFDAYDIASYDYSDANGNGKIGYEIDAGDYIFTARKNSHEVVLEQTKTLSDLHLANAQVTGNVITNRFVDSPNANALYNYSSISPTMTIMSRANMIATFPKAPTAEELILEPGADNYNTLAEGTNYKITEEEIRAKLNFGFVFGRESGEGYVFDEANELWSTVLPANIIPDTWTQAADKSGTVGIRLPELMGVDPYDTVNKIVSTNTLINGKTGAEAWELFMNQLTYAELVELNSTGFFKTAEIDRVGKEESCDPDGPACIGGQTKNGYISARGPSGTRYWASAQMVCSTWNTELAHEQGVLIGEEGMWNGYNGWYAPSMDTHRSPFSGRNFEYYAQDGVVGGLISGAVISGVSSKGIYPYVKHFALNDQETARGGICTWADEQTIRENYLRVFQYAVEQGGASAIMSGFNRIGSVANSEHYPLLTQILREEWGFKGHIVTDWAAGTVADKCNNLEIMTRSGNNIPLVDKGEDARGGGVWDATLRGGKGGVKAPKVSIETSTNSCGCETTTIKYSTTEFTSGERTHDLQYYYARTRAMETLYTHVRSNAIDNGADFQKNFASKAIVMPAGASYTLTLTPTFVENADVVYEIAKSDLPAGVTYNAKTMTFTANKAAVGAGSIDIKVIYDGWVSKVVSFPVTVVEPIDFKGDLAVAKSAAYEASFSQSFWTPKADIGAKEAGIVSVTPSVKGLPEGLTFDAATGKISGSVAAAGEYKLTLNYEVVTRTVSSGYSGVTVRDNKANYSKAITLTVGTLVEVSIDGVVSKIESGEKVTKPADPVAPEGQRFVGWFVGNDAFDFDTAITEKTAIVSKFEAIPDSIEFRVEGGMLQARINGTEWADVVTVASITGPQGAAGAKGDTGATGANGTNGTNGAIGADGLGIKSAEINEEGHLILTMTDNSTKDAGVVVAKSGCGSVILSSGIAMFALLAAAAVVCLRKKG